MIGATSKPDPQKFPLHLIMSFPLICCLDVGVDSNLGSPHLSCWRPGKKGIQCWRRATCQSERPVLSFLRARNKILLCYHCVPLSLGDVSLKTNSTLLIHRYIKTLGKYVQESTKKVKEKNQPTTLRAPLLMFCHTISQPFPNH